MTDAVALEHSLVDKLRSATQRRLYGVQAVTLAEVFAKSQQFRPDLLRNGTEHSTGGCLTHVECVQPARLPTCKQIDVAAPAEVDI